MRGIGFLLLLLGLAGAGVQVLSMGTSGGYNVLLGHLHDEVEGTPGLSRMQWEDERSNSMFWLAVFGVTAVLGGVLIGAAPKPAIEGQFQKCPVCAELVRREAVKCRYCGADLLALASSQQQPADSLTERHFTGRFNCPGCGAGRPYENSVEIYGRRYCETCVKAGKAR